MIKFGPSGNSEEFYAAGYKRTHEAMEWLQSLGLNAYEYSFGRGVHLKEDTARLIGENAGKFGITLSVHAPYFINLAVEEEEKFEKNLEYFLESSRAAVWLGAGRVVFHPGSPMKQERREAFEKVLVNFKRIRAAMDEAGYQELIYCPETMGKINQLGDLEEIIELVNLDERTLPTIDFGHLHTRTRGGLRSEEDFREVLNRLEEGIGFEKVKRMHVHFSKIEYTAMGEKQHRTFADQGFGPNFEDLVNLLLAKNLEPIIICESKGTMAKDALQMKKIYEAALAEKK